MAAKETLLKETDMETFLPEVLSGTVLAVVLGIYKVFQLLAKVIPDDKGGFLGIVRKVAKVLSMYTVNKKSGAG